MFATRRLVVVDVRVRPYKEVVAGSSPAAPTVKGQSARVAESSWVEPSRRAAATDGQATSGPVARRSAGMTVKVSERWSGRGRRRGIDWIIDRYYVKTDKASGIVTEPNQWVWSAASLATSST